MTQERYHAAAPTGVRTFASTREFIDELPSRQSRWEMPGDLAGWDIADGFRLTEGADPDSYSEWRISVHERSVYAVLRRFPHERTFTFTGPVWLIDSVPDRINPDAATPAMKRLTTHLEQLRPEPNSLVRATHETRFAFDLLRAAEHTLKP